MSYLPRMSKTYKEPEEQPPEDPVHEITFNSIPIASALPDDKACNPQSILKQYSYYPHPPPQLPGPSVLREAERNERISIEARKRRSRDVIAPEEDDAETTEETQKEMGRQESTDQTTVNYALVEAPPLHETMSTSPRKTGRGGIVQGKKTQAKPSKSKEGKVVNILQNESDSHGNQQKVLGPDVKPCVKNNLGDVPSKGSSEQKEVESHVKREKRSVVIPDIENLLPSSGKHVYVQEGTQCSTVRCGERLCVMPPSVNYLIKTLAFLTHEVEKIDEGEDEDQPKEVKKLLAQIDEIIDELSEHKSDSRFEFETSVTDTKRLEKICADLDNYIKQIYGEKGKLGCKSQEKKRISCDILQKDYELKVLNEKLRETDIQNPSLKSLEPIAKAPEIVLQNKDLENEQLAAEVEFNSQEMKRYQAALAEKSWDIQRSREEITLLKRKLAALKIKSKKTVKIPL